MPAGGADDRQVRCATLALTPAAIWPGDTRRVKRRGRSRGALGAALIQAEGGEVFGALARTNARPGAGNVSAGRGATTLGGRVRTVV